MIIEARTLRISSERNRAQAFAMNASSSFFYFQTANTNLMMQNAGNCQNWFCFLLLFSRIIRSRAAGSDLHAFRSARLS